MDIVFIEPFECSYEDLSISLINTSKYLDFLSISLYPWSQCSYKYEGSKKL